MKQLSNCCKAEIKLTGEDRPNHFACKKCGRIIGTPLKQETKSNEDWEREFENMTTKKDEEWIKEFEMLFNVTTTYRTIKEKKQKHWLQTLLTEKKREIQEAYSKGRSDEAKTCSGCQGECEKRVEEERERIEEIIKDEIPLFECVDCGFFYSSDSYDNPAFYADKVANCPDCNKKCWHVNTDGKLTQPIKED